MVDAAHILCQGRRPAAMTGVFVAHNVGVGLQTGANVKRRRTGRLWLWRTGIARRCCRLHLVGTVGRAARSRVCCAGSHAGGVVGVGGVLPPT